MHEGPVTEEIIRIACEAAAAQQGRVTAISLVVGEDSGFIGESIQMYFNVRIVDRRKNYSFFQKIKVVCFVIIAESC